MNLTDPAVTPAELPERVAMERLADAKCLLLDYFVGRATRPAALTAPPLALRPATHPAGQEVFVASFVDLAHLADSYGDALTAYLHQKAPEAQLFGHSALFLREFLFWEEPAPTRLAGPFCARNSWLAA